MGFLSVLRKMKQKEKEMRILMLYPLLNYIVNITLKPTTGTLLPYISLINCLEALTMLARQQY